MGQNRNSDSDLKSEKSESAICQDKIDIKFAKAKEEIKKHKCTYPNCDKIFNRPSRLARHLRGHTGEKTYKCCTPGCDKAYTNSSHLKRHMETHSVIKKLYQCSECSIQISNLSNLKRHYKNVHSDLDKLRCKECNAVFTKKYQLKAHVTTHHTVEHKCDQCEKTFKNIQKFKRHRASHNESTKFYACTVLGCNEIFEKWHLLCAHKKSQHIVNHKCKQCDKAFFSKSHLRIHSQVHNKNREVIPCPYEKCPRVYYSKGNLDIHVKTKHLNRKYECDICKQLLSSKRRLQTHIQNLHVLEARIKKTKKLQRRKRKDAGKPKRSVVSALIGLDLPPKVEKLVLERREDIEYIEKFDEISNTKEQSELQSS